MTTARRQPVLRQILTHSERSPEKTAVISGDGSLSYGELAETIRSRAGSLVRNFGVRPGDRIVLMAGVHAEFVCTYLAAHAIGAVCVPLDPHAAQRRLADVAQRVTPRVVVTETGDGSGRPERVSFDALATADDASRGIDFSELDAADTADVLFTTGTTGKSKGVVLSHNALATACAHINAFIGTGGDAVEVLPLPLSHSFGLGRLRCILTLGATLVLVPGFVNAASILRTIAKHRATGFASVPTGIAILLSDSGATLRRFAKQLDYIEIGSSTMPLEQKHQLMKLLPNTRICMHYGLTEASRSAYLSFHDDRERLKSIGRPSPGVEMRVADDSGNEAGRGKTGRIQVRGDHLMSAYWQDPELTAKTLKDGWLDTGDLGRCDDQGYYYLTSRSSDIINVGGRKVAPEEIEAVLSGHPAVAECACVGIPDPQGLSGEIISAFLVAHADIDKLPPFAALATLLRQHVEPYKIPRRFTWLDALPKTSSGKLMRRELKKFT